MSHQYLSQITGFIQMCIAHNVKNSSTFRQLEMHTTLC